MKFKIDENMPTEVADDLRAAGHEADTVADEGLSGGDDPTVLRHASAARRTLITLDKGIGDLRRLVLADDISVIVLRPHATGRGAVLAFARRHLPSLMRRMPVGKLIIVSDRGIRVR